MKQVIRGIFCGLGALLLVGGVASAAPQGDAQQKCINKINKDMIKVHAAQGKLNAGCVKDAVKTGSDAEACLNADAKGKVGKKKSKTIADEGKRCVGLMPAPEFAYISAVTANAAAETAEKDLIHDVFGSPVGVGSGLYLCDTFPDECKCQTQVIDRVQKTFRAMSKLFVKCKNKALAIEGGVFPGGAASASDIAQCVTNGSIGLSVEADQAGKVGDAVTQISDSFGQFCTPGGNDEFVGGDCAATGAGAPACLEQRARCRFCQMVNAGDGLSINCATWSGGACP